MDEVLEYIICLILKNKGFNTAEKRSILLLKEALSIYLSSILRVLHSYTIHSKKQNSNIFDFLKLLTGKDLKFKNDMPALNFVNEEEEHILEFRSPLATYLERYIHIYDFMPPFPPTHTFRQTYQKNKDNLDKSTQVKTRLEQNLKAEKNLLKLFKKSKGLPSFVNYLHTKKS